MKQTRKTSLRTLVWLAVSGAIAFFMVLFLFVFQWNITRLMKGAERDHLAELSQVIQGALNSSMRDLYIAAHSWASWDETYEFALRHNEDFITVNLLDNSVPADLIFLYDQNGQELYAAFPNTPDESPEIPSGLGAYIAPFCEDVLRYQGRPMGDGFPDGPYGDVGFILYQEIPYLLCIMPILKSDDSGAPAGTFAFFRKYGNEQFLALTQLSGTQFRFSEQDAEHPIEGHEYSIPLKDVVSMKTPLWGALRQHEVVLQMDHPRILYLNAHWSMLLMAAALSGTLLVLMVVLLWIVEHYLLRPLDHFTSDVAHIGQYGSIDIRQYERHLEFHTLGVTINEMLDRLEKSYLAEKESSSSISILKNILNGMDAYLYVSDPTTDEILFINDKMKKHFGIQGEGVGQICWKILQSGFTQRCEFCPCYKLVKDPNEIVVWEEHNTVTNHYYRNTDLLIDWEGDRKVHMQHSVDITDVKLAEMALQKRLGQQALMTDIAQNFISKEDYATLINRALQMTGEFLNITRILLVRYDEKAQVMECINEWNHPHQPLKSKTSEHAILSLSPPSIVVAEKLQRGALTYLSSDEPGPADDVNRFQPQLPSFLCTPIFLDGVLWGVLDFGKLDTQVPWTESDINLAKLVSSIFSGVLSRQRMDGQLIAAKEQAEQGSRAKSEFLSRMSHEMRTPMNAIIGMTNIAHSTDDVKKKEYCLDKIDNASRHLLGVINDILDMSKIEANKFELSSAEFNLDHALMNIINVIHFRMEEKSQTFTLFVDPDIPSVLIGDEQRLSQVITNLLTNAVKFTPERGSIALSVQRKSDENGTLTLQVSVKDSGIGISADQQQKLFHSFEQADGSIARKFGGTGLGLVISKRIVELMGGTIWIESELGAGSTFLFTMKVQKGDEREVKNLKDKIAQSDLHVLVVDDAPETCDYVAHVMKQLNVPCQTALSGTEALHLVETASQPFNMVFVDWKMPDMNGVDLAKELRKRKDDRSIIIMISASEWSEIETYATGAGINGFIPKPLFPTLISDCIHRYVDADAPEQLTLTKPLPIQHFAGKTALLAEDVDINREIVLTILEGTELVIDCAVDGREAVQKFSANPDRYDIIFMDVHMPEVDGLEATRQIRALDLPKAHTIPIIAMTANVFKEDVDRCLQAGMNDHVGKPIDFDELQLKLVKYLV